ncbi:NfeD family protein [Wenzhouxiangella sp. XN24]|uniref:NfeD family protein n=1 Tax=Wenzhouxiangella sp. XN24 TaxID=2713569 RepID=UPI0013EBAA05|nr:NfeD family protein [Wenzhouxiangella sp. XN24]NGX16344.1 NfeD family protein [Wenzhouxiangella sp. XN24]
MNIDFSVSPAAVWTLLGVLLILAEFALPGVILVFFGIAALLIGIALWFGVGMTLNTQILVFGLLAVGLLLVARKRVKSWFLGKSELASDGIEVLVPGTPVTAQEDFVDGIGVVTYRGARWNAECSEPVAGGQRLWITGRRGLVLNVSSERPGE